MKTKLILASLAMVVLMVAAVGAGTLAYFTDTETIEDNTFTAGTIEMCVDNLGEAQVVGTESYSYNLKPCEVGVLEEVITNVGNNPIDVWKHTYDVTDSGGLNPTPEKELCGFEDPECSELLMSEDIAYDLSSSKRGEIVNEVDGYTLANIECCWFYLGRLNPGEVMEVEQSYHLSGDVGNEYQGDIVTFDMEFMATQTVGGALGPSPICGI